MAYVGTPRPLGDDIQTLASIIQGEAGGEGLLGMQAVADVIRNRASQNFSGYGSDPLSQALARNQFQGQSSKVSPEAIAVAEQLKTGNLPSVTKGAVYYANPGDSTASWARRLNDQNALKIGNHYFTDNAKGQPFAGSAYAGMPDGPKGQEAYAQPVLGPSSQPSPLAPPGIPVQVANDFNAMAEDGSQQKTPAQWLQSVFGNLAKTPDAPAIRFGPIGDARQSGDALLKAMNAPTLSDLLSKKRLVG